MGLTLGRVGLDVTLDEISKYSLKSNKDVDLTGSTYVSGTLADAKVLRQQLEGLVDNVDEPFVPLTWSEDSTVDGYYAVKDVDIDTDAGGYIGGWFPIKISLERIIHYQAARFEAHTLGFNRSNFGGSNQVPWIALPPDATGITNDVIPTINWGTRTGPGGTLPVLFNTASQVLYDGYTGYQVAPADYYDMAATLKIDGKVVTGRSIPAAGNFTDWEISNGLFKLAPATDMLTFTPTKGSATGTYGTAGGFIPQFYDSFFSNWISLTPAMIDSIAVRRNGPEEVVIGIGVVGVPAATTKNFRFYLHVGVRRGARLAELHFDSINSSQRFALKANSATAWSTSSEAMYETSDNGDTNRWVMANFNGYTFDTANKRLETGTTVGNMQIGFGANVGGVGAAANETRADIVLQYGAATGERTRLVDPG